MSAFVPSGDPWRDEAVFATIREDKERAAEGGFDGSGVAHPGLVGTVREVSCGDPAYATHRAGYSICYMGEDELLESLARVAAETDQLRATASSSLREAVGKAADRGLTQTQIARTIGRSQPEVSRLVRAYRATRFQPASPLGRVLTRHRDEILALARAHKASNVRVFGSVVRGEDDDASDIDLLVDLDPGADLLDLAALDLELGRLLGRPVDVVPARMLKPHVAPAALADAVEL